MHNIEKSFFSNVKNYHANNKNNVSLNKLNKLCSEHDIWSNPLLKSCLKGDLSIEDYRFIFSQYYYYSKNFTKLLSACMLNCDNDYYRSMLSSNLWEEGGGKEIEKRHSELFRRFLKDSLQIKIGDIKFEVYTKYFFDQYLNLCLNQGPIVSTAALSFGTEGIISDLYTIFYQGLKSIGFKDDQLIFFNLHIECDDDHAETLKEMAFFYQTNKEWLELCEKGILRALDLRNDFFSHLYESLQSRKLKYLTERARFPSENISEEVLLNLQSNINQDNNRLYHNTDIDNNINFSVQRVPFEADILDPRIVVIPPGFRNEFHSHAHESVFLITEGIGEITVGNKVISVQKGDLVFAPRWCKHQAHNIGNNDFKYFAVTDYGFTKLFPQNSEEIYRLKKENINV